MKLKPINVVIVNSRFQLHEFNFTNSTSRIHEFNLGLISLCQQHKEYVNVQRELRTCADSDFGMFDSELLFLCLINNEFMKLREVTGTSVAFFE